MNYLQEDSDDTEEGEPELEAPEKPLVGTSTESGKNKFKLPLYLRIMGNRTLRPVNKKEFAHYVIILSCEYPKVEDEINAKRENMLYDEYHSMHYLDVDAVAEWRVRRCLRSWDFHKKLPGFTKRVIREGDLLTEDSMLLFRALPPLIRKEISARIWNALGVP